MSAVNSARKIAPKSTSSSVTTLTTRRSVSIRSRKESAGGRLRRTSTGGSTSVSRSSCARFVAGSGILVWASATGFRCLNALDGGMSRAFSPASGRERAGQRGDACRIDRPPQPLAQLHRGFPAEQLTRERDVRLADLRIVGGKRLEDDLRARARDLDHGLGQLEERELVRVADVHGLVHTGFGEPDDPVDEVI